MVRTSKEELGVTSKAKPADSSSSYGSLVPPTTLVLSTPWVNTPPARGRQVVVPPAPSEQPPNGPPRRGVVRSRSENSWRLIPTSLLRARIARSLGTLSKYRPQ